jgi:hypothetical protein
MNGTGDLEKILAARRKRCEQPVARKRQDMSELVWSRVARFLLVQYSKDGKKIY